MSSRPRSKVSMGGLSARHPRGIVTESSAVCGRERSRARHPASAVDAGRFVEEVRSDGPSSRTACGSWSGLAAGG
jgi:hypothetical protein